MVVEAALPSILYRILANIKSESGLAVQTERT